MKRISNALQTLLPLLFFPLGINLAVALYMEYGKEGIKSPDVALFPTAVFLLYALFGLGTVVFNAVRKFRGETNGFALGAALALEAYCFTETCTGTSVAKESVMFFFAAPLFIYAFYLLGGIIFKNPKIYYIVLSVLFHICGLIQFFVYSFRGAPVRASDLSNIASAMEISGDYSFVGGGGLWLIIFAVLDLAAAVFITVRVKLTPIKLKKRLWGLPLMTAFVIAFGVYAIRLYDFGVENRIIKLNFSGGEDLTSYKDTGNMLLLYLDIRNAGSHKPDGYSDERALEILSKYSQSDETPGRTPTVIAIMDESLADFALLGDLQTDRDYMPFYHSLSENTVKGYVTVSAYGGYSCNSEFEFLTGNSMGFFPNGSAAYTQYMKTPQDSLVSYFKGYGYQTLSMAGCSRTLWKLGEAYEKFGFEKQLYQSDLKSMSNKYVNSRISDESLFRQLIAQYEKKDKNKPMFAFMTTMQNHAAYKLNDIPEEIAVKAENISDPTASAYLSYVRATDNALKMLVEYFSQVDEDVVIVLFGDHYPHIPEFSEALLGSSLGTLSTEQNASIHKTPFFIWANYDIEEQEGVSISLNYLSNRLIEVCDMPKTDFQLYLDDVCAQVPSISSFGYRGADGKWYRVSEKSDYTDTLTDYNIVQYYRMFEKYK